jgi:hypothetical protein
MCPHVTVLWHAARLADERVPPHAPLRECRHSACGGAWGKTRVSCLLGACRLVLAAYLSCSSSSPHVGMSACRRLSQCNLTLALGTATRTWQCRCRRQLLFQRRRLCGEDAPPAPAPPHPLQEAVCVGMQVHTQALEGISHAARQRGGVLCVVCLDMQLDREWLRLCVDLEVANRQQRPWLIATSCALAS